MFHENPWLSIWMRPRSTIRSVIAENPKKSLGLLAYIYGFASLLNCFQTFPIALHYGILPMLLIAILVAPFWGYAFFNIWSYVVVKVGKIFKGQASFENVRAAYAWSCVPLAGNIPLWMLLIFFYSDFLFYGADDHVLMPGAIILLFVVLITKLIFAVWSLVVFLQTLSEVQQFSVLRAIGNVVVSSLVIGVATVILWSIFIFMFRVTIV